MRSVARLWAKTAFRPVCLVSVPLSETPYQWTTIHVPAMDCPQELGLIRRGLHPLGGIEQLQADYLDRSLRVLYDPNRIDPARIRARLGEIGFPAGVGPIVSAEGPLPSVWQAWVHSPDCLLATLACLVIVLARWCGWSPIVAATAAIAAIAWAGPPIGANAWRALRLGRLDMHVLITLAACGALLTGEWFEAAAVTVLFRLALVIEHTSQRRTRRAIHALVQLTPQIAHRLPDDQTTRAVDVSVEQLQVGDRLLVRPGERIPADGRVVWGESSVDEAVITGESAPVDKALGDPVFAGTLCGEGTLRINVTRRSTESTLARISRLIDQARGQPAPSERLVDRFARVYTPLVILLAILIAVVPPLVIWLVPAGNGGFTSGGELVRGWVFRGLILLVIACPCALVLSTPITIVCGLYRASRLGALIKGGVFLEQLGQVGCVAFDKTGTLTGGKPHVVAVEPLGELDATEVIRIAAALETQSEHPLAQAIVQAAPPDWPACESFRVLRGLGVQARIGPDEYIVGSPRYFLEQAGVPSTAIDPLYDRHPGASIALLARGADDGGVNVLGAIYLRDEPRSDAYRALQHLRRLGVRELVMLTGDHQPAAEYISQQLGIDTCHADLLPEDKIHHVRELANRDVLLAMVGDGVNDAPALAAAPIGIALGSAASDIALETADVAILTPHVDRVTDLVRLSKWVRQVLIQNIVLAIGIKLMVLILALFGLATMWMAVVADMGASLIVIANATRILNGALPPIPPR